MSHYQNQPAVCLKLVITAPLLAILLLSGCQKRQEPSTAGKAHANNAVQSPPPAAPAPEANIFVDEARLARPYAIIGGTVQNVSAERLEKLSVEIELKRRADGSVERREVAVQPGELEPGKQGKYSLRVLSDEWSGSRVVRLRSGTRAQEVAFKPLPGAKRPPETVRGKTITVDPPARKKPEGGDFINTPDTPYKVP